VLGGVESIIASHQRLLSAAGYEVRVVAGRGECVEVPELDSRHPEVEAVTKALAAGEFDRSRFESLRRRIAQGLAPALEGVDLVIAHNVMSMAFNLPLLAALRDHPGPILAWTHDIAWANPRHAAFHRSGPPYELLREVRPGTRYVAISERVRGQLSATYGVNSAVVPNGVDRLTLLRIRPETARLLQPTGLLAADPLVLVPFRVTRRKRLELAIEAYASLAARHPGAALCVSGPLGPHSADNRAYWAELAALQARLPDPSKVVFLHELGDPHPVDDAMVGELYQLAAAVLLPSESEGFGLPVLEAGLARVPVVCTDLDVFDEVAGDEVWKFAPEAGGDLIGEVLAQALDSRTARLQSRVAARFSWDRVLPLVEREIQDAI